MISKNASPVNEFDPSLWSSLVSTLEQATHDAHGPRIAAFDADGTLWDADAGETFFDWQIRNCQLPAFRGVDPWQRYHELKNPDPRVGYVWLAQINAGQTLEQVRAWADQCFKNSAPWPVLESQRRLIQKLRELKFDIYVVTASVKWAVEPGARAGHPRHPSSTRHCMRKCGQPSAQLALDIHTSLVLGSEHHQCL